MKTILPDHPHTRAITIVEAGHVYETEFGVLRFQHGPITSSNPRNGLFNEDLLTVLIDRLNYFQNEHAGGEFTCPENQDAIDHLLAAKTALEQRTQKRVAQGVEGRHEPHQS